MKRKERDYAVTYSFGDEEEYYDSYATLPVDAGETWDDTNKKLFDALCYHEGVKPDEIGHFEWWYSD